MAKVTTLAGGQCLPARPLHSRLQRDLQLRAGGSGERLRPAGHGGSRADSLSPGGARWSARDNTVAFEGRAFQLARQPGRRIVRRPVGDDPPASHRGVLDLVRRATARPVSGRARAATRPAHGGAACGSCRCRGRQERVHRTLENAQSAFSTAPTGLTYEKAVRSLVKRKRTDHLSTTRTSCSPSKCPLEAEWASRAGTGCGHAVRTANVLISKPRCEVPSPHANDPPGHSVTLTDAQ